MPPKKVKATKGPRGMPKPLSSGIVITDLMKKEWRLGPVIGQGGFGYIYLAGPGSLANITSENAENVIKVEPHENGPLFVELAFYQRAAKKELISNWLKSTKKSQIGVPQYIATGLFENSSQRFRFLVMDRYGLDVQKVYSTCGFVFPEQTVFSLGLRILDCLEYIHEHEYCHADIKSSNLMLGRKKSNLNKVYLVDYGLAYRYSPKGVHCQYKEDPKRKHDGTIEYTSRDAHKGCAPARRGDLEILGYCMIQWLCKKLPWEDKLTDQEYVSKQKEKHMKDIPNFLKICFKGNGYPNELQEFMKYVDTIDYTEKPDYKKVRTIFTKRLNTLGFKDDGVSIILPTTQQKKIEEKERVASPVKRNRKTLNKSILESPQKQAAQKSPRKRAAGDSMQSPAKKKVKSPVSKNKTQTLDETIPESPRKRGARSPVKRAANMQSPIKKNPVQRNRKTPLKSASGSPLKKSNNQNKSLAAKTRTKRGSSSSPIDLNTNSPSSPNVSDYKTARRRSPRNSISPQQPSKRQNCGTSGNSSSSDRRDTNGRIVHLRRKRKNVQTVDFAQSP